MAQKSSKDRMKPISLYPVTPEQAITGMFKIKPDDVKRIVSNRPGRKRAKK